ncbi:ABC transporter substrate binding protein [Candidatus Albibeggiatoa sp. nov. BB20]|uniref:ABC transporter substrate binding protein n=1 Tax=Candidatus Albibeggiatoa sp. nov. BB20 TaxID=3162723 RepID=UPI0033657AA6
MKIKQAITVLTQQVILIFLCSTAFNSFAAEEIIFSAKPKTNPEDKPWRIGFYQGGPLDTYPKVLAATVKGLVELGWLVEEELPPSGIKLTSTNDIWDHLANLDNRYLDFVGNAFWSAEWDENLRQKHVEKMIHRFNTRQDIDFMIAMGTWAGIDLANDRHKTKLLVFDAADAVKSKIINSIYDSGLDHINARVDPLRYKRQIRLFSNLIGFKKLGVAYENSEVGEVYSAIDDVRAVGKELDFKVVRCFTKSEVPDSLLYLAEESLRKCYQEFLESVDAVYITYQRGTENASILKELLDMLNEAGIYTFSQTGSDHVRLGALMSIALVSYKGVGRFHAETMAKILNGAKPRELSQIYSDSMNIAINLDTAKEVNFDPPISLLGATDELYSKELQEKQKQDAEFFY